MGPNKGKRLFFNTEDQIDRDLDIKLRTLYKIPNKENGSYPTIVAALPTGPKIYDNLNAEFEIGIVFTTEAIYFRGQVSRTASPVLRMKYSEIYSSIKYSWNRFSVSLYKKNGKLKIIPICTISLLYSDIDPPYLANLIEDLAGFYIEELSALSYNSIRPLTEKPSNTKTNLADATVSSFISFLGRGEFRKAYNLQKISSWGTYERFSSKSLFGGITQHKLLMVHE